MSRFAFAGASSACGLAFDSASEGAVGEVEVVHASSGGRRVVGRRLVPASTGVEVEASFAAAFVTAWAESVASGAM